MKQKLLTSHSMYVLTILYQCCTYHLTDINLWLTLVSQCNLEKEPLVKISHTMTTKVDISVFMFTNFCCTWTQLTTLKISELFRIIPQNTSLDTALWSSRLWQHVGWYTGSSVSEETAPFASRLWQYIGWYMGFQCFWGNCSLRF